jgi:DNA-binding LacI/PurR family transcriptional regulator
MRLIVNKRSNGKMNRSTLSEVAERAGVSPTTASLVLGGKSEEHRISEETYLRVKKAAEELDYSPNLLVHSMQHGRTHILSFYNAFRNRVIDDLYMDRLSAAIENAGGLCGYDILVHSNFTRSPEETYRFLNGGRADGLLLFAPLPDDPLLALFRKSRMPVLLINARDEEGILPSVKDDMVSGMRQVAEKLVQLGHQKIAALTEEGREDHDSRARITLLRQFLRENGGDLPDNRIINLANHSRSAVIELIRSSDAPTVIFCWRDWLAYFVLEICEEEGISVPEQLSVVGYDGLHWPSTTRHVAASVHVDLKELASASVKLLDRYISEDVAGNIQQALPVFLEPGTTLGPPGYTEK